jgi:uncharacterized HhH-GPD family protein
VPKLERLDWIAPLSDGLGVTLSNDPDANLLLEEEPNALLLGVLYDSQFQTRKAFAIPLLLKQRMGHIDMNKMAANGVEPIQAAFTTKPSLHRFPNKFAQLTHQLATFVSARYGGDSARIWTEAEYADDLGDRLMDLPSFGVEKTNWTIGMVGRLGYLPFDGWEGYLVQPKPKKRTAAKPAS